MTTAVIVQARMNSTRLPGKVLMDLGGVSVLEHVLLRCRAIVGVDIVCCAVPVAEANDPVADEAARLGIEVFRGSEDDVLDRYYQAAKHLGADMVMRVTSDCPLIDPEICGLLLDLRKKKNADYACNNMPPNWPHGLDCEVVTFAWLERSAIEAKKGFEREHVTQYVRNHHDAKKVNLEGPGGTAVDHRWTLDNARDMEFLRTLWQHLPPVAGWREVLAIVEANPELAAINAGQDRLEGLEKSMREGTLALFRFDASAAIGGGHAMRCLTLAGAMADLGWQCRFAVGPDSPATVSGLSDFRDDILVLECPADTEADKINVWLGEKCDLLIVDHYQRDARFEKSCRRFAKRIMVIDDLADRPHDCDFLLDQTFGRTENEYKSLVPDTCKFLLGSAYALIAPIFFKLREKALIERARRATIGRVLVCFGLSDPDNLTEKAMRGIAASGLDLDIDVVLGGGAPHLEKVRNCALEMGKKVKVTTNATDIAERMALADIAIGGGGTSSWERCCMGLPTLVVIVAENQKTVAEKLAQSGAVILLGPDSIVEAEIIARNLSALDSDNDRIKCMQQDAADICDGLGTKRVMVNLAIGGAGGAEKLSLRPADITDAKHMLDWRNDAATRHGSIHSDKISSNRHIEWLEDVLADPDRDIRVAVISDMPIGTIRADKDDNGWKLSWTVAPEARVHGFGKRIVALMIKSLSGKIRAEIKTDNIASLRIAEALKMIKVSESQGLSVWTTETNGD